MLSDLKVASFWTTCVVFFVRRNWNYHDAYYGLQKGAEDQASVFIIFMHSAISPTLVTFCTVVLYQMLWSSHTMSEQHGNCYYLYYSLTCVFNFLCDCHSWQCFLLPRVPWQSVYNLEGVVEIVFSINNIY